MTGKSDNVRYSIAHSKRARVVFSEKDRNIVSETRKNAVAGIDAVLKYFSLRFKFPLINIFIAPGRKEYDFFVAHLTPVPTSKGRIGQPQAVDLYLLSPNAYKRDADHVYLKPGGIYNKAMYGRFIVHEMVHMAEEYISPRGAMDARPRWWSEGLAVYLSGQYRESGIQDLMKKALAGNHIPSIDELSGPNAYIWGWTVIKYIETRFGKSKIRHVLERTNNFNLSKILGVNSKNFEQKWRKFVETL